MNPSIPHAFRERLVRLRRNGGWLILVLAVATLGVIGTCYQRSQRLKESARLVAQHDLVVRHWSALEINAEFRPVIDTLFRVLDVGPDGQTWRIRAVQSLASQPVTLDAFEQEALERIEAGQDEVWQQSLTGNRRYVRAVRAKQHCIVCHPQSARGTMTKENDVIGVLSLESVAGAAKAPRTSAAALALRD